MTDRKKPGVAFWATVVVVVLLVAYPLSFGPVCSAITEATSPAFDPIVTFYKPLIVAVRYPDWQWPRSAICWYGGESGSLVYRAAVVSIAGGSSPRLRPCLKPFTELNPEY